MLFCDFSNLTIKIVLTKIVIKKLFDKYFWILGKNLIESRFFLAQTAMESQEGRMLFFLLIVKRPKEALAIAKKKSIVTDCLKCMAGLASRK